MPDFEGNQQARQVGLSAIEEMLGAGAPARPQRGGEEGFNQAAPASHQRSQLDDIQLEGGEGEEMVPVSALKDRLSRQAKKHEKEKSELERLRAEVQALKKQSNPDLKTRIAQAMSEEFQDSEEMTADQARWAKLAELVEDAVSTRVSDVDRKLQDMQFMQSLTADQRDAVTAVRETYPSVVEPKHLLALARAEDPIAFEGEPGHGARGVGLQPGRGSAQSMQREQDSSREETIRRLASLPEDDNRRAAAGPMLVEQILSEQGLI